MLESFVAPSLSFVFSAQQQQQQQDDDEDDAAATAAAASRTLPNLYRRDSEVERWKLIRELQSSTLNGMRHSSQNHPNNRHQHSMTNTTSSKQPDENNNNETKKKKEDEHEHEQDSAAIVPNRTFLASRSSSLWWKRGTTSTSTSNSTINAESSLSGSSSKRSIPATTRPTLLLSRSQSCRSPHPASWSCATATDPEHSFSVPKSEDDHAVLIEPEPSLLSPSPRRVMRKMKLERFLSLRNLGTATTNTFLTVTNDENNPGDESNQDQHHHHQQPQQQQCDHRVPCHHPKANEGSSDKKKNNSHNFHRSSSSSSLMRRIQSERTILSSVSAGPAQSSTEPSAGPASSSSSLTGHHRPEAVLSSYPTTLEHEEPCFKETTTASEAYPEHSRKNDDDDDADRWSRRTNGPFAAAPMASPAPNSNAHQLPRLSLDVVRPVGSSPFSPVPPPPPPPGKLQRRTTFLDRLFLRRRRNTNPSLYRSPHNKQTKRLESSGTTTAAASDRSTESDCDDDDDDDDDEEETEDCFGLVNRCRYLDEPYGRSEEFDCSIDDDSMNDPAVDRYHEQVAAMMESSLSTFDDVTLSSDGSSTVWTYDQSLTMASLSSSSSSSGTTVTTTATATATAANRHPVTATSAISGSMLDRWSPISFQNGNPHHHQHHHHHQHPTTVVIAEAPKPPIRQITAGLPDPEHNDRKCNNNNNNGQCPDAPKPPVRRITSEAEILLQQTASSASAALSSSSAPTSLTTTTKTSCRFSIIHEEEMVSSQQSHCTKDGRWHHCTSHHRPLDVDDSSTFTEEDGSVISLLSGLLATYAANRKNKVGKIVTVVKTPQHNSSTSSHRINGIRDLKSCLKTSTPIDVDAPPLRAFHDLSVRFDRIQIRKYERTLGDNPSCSSGPPISLGWTCLDVQDYAVEDYERNIKPYKKRSKREYHLSAGKRQDILIQEWDISLDQIRHARREVIHQQYQREKTANLGGRLPAQTAAAREAAFLRRANHQKMLLCKADADSSDTSQPPELPRSLPPVLPRRSASISSLDEAGTHQGDEDYKSDRDSNSVCLAPPPPPLRRQDYEELPPWPRSSSSTSNGIVTSNPLKGRPAKFVSPFVRATSRSCRAYSSSDSSSTVCS